MNEFGVVYENVSLKEYTTLKIGGIAHFLIRPYDEKSLCNLISYLKENNLKYYILGNGSNVILDDKYFQGVVIKLDNLNNITINKNIVNAECGVMLPKLVHVCLEKGLVSLAFASMIPGTVGASVYGNAGANGNEIMNYVKSVRVLTKEGKIKELKQEDITYGYRYTSLKDYIILNVTFELEQGDTIKALMELQERNEKRKNTQPLDKKNVGSIFKNPENTSAGKLIDDLGLKGFQIGGAKISEKHANFIINENDASFKDVVNLINFIKRKVKQEYNIDLEVEPSIVKWDEL